MRNIENIDFCDGSKAILFLIEDLVSNSSYQSFGNRSSGRPLVVKLPSQTVSSVKIRLQCLEVLHLLQVDFLCDGKSVLSDASLRNEMDVKQSSLYKDNVAFQANKLLQEHGIFHSKKEKEPCVEFIFPRATTIEEIVIHNYSSQYFYRAFSAAVFVNGNGDGEGYRCVHDNWKSKKALIQLIDSVHPDSITRLERLALLIAVSAAFCDLGAIQSIFKVITASYDEATVNSIYFLLNRFLGFSGYGFNQHGLIRPFGLMSSSDLKEIALELSKFISLIKSEVGYEVVLTSGTLLGAYRDKKFITNDDDIDLAVLMKSKHDNDVVLERAQLLKSLNEAGISSVDSSHVQIQCKLPSGVNIDLFPAWESAEGFALSPLPRGVLTKEDIFPIVQLELYNNELPVPKNIEKVLVNNYGSQWWKPDPIWRFDWDKANREYRIFLGKNK